MAILVLAQHNNKTLSPATRSAITAAARLGKDIHLLLAGYNCATLAKNAGQIEHLTKILHTDAPHFEHALAEELTPLIVKLAENSDYSHILTSASSFGKNILPRVAAILDIPQISNVSKIIDPQTFIQPVYTGNALATIQSNAPCTALTIRTTLFEQAPMHDKKTTPIEAIDPTPPVNLSRFIQKETIETERPELTNAKIVIAGGRALGSIENFKMIETLADKLGGAVGATRAAVDAGFIPNDAQIGQTGKVIAPDLYIAIGLSGAIQHTSGIKDSKTIIVINNDDKAPICEMADYILTKDLFEAIPKLIEKL
ncbi:MAG: FAD-binding protein [Alphaproteobacteria bacterium]